MEINEKGFVIVHKDFMDFVKCIVHTENSTQFKLSSDINDAIIFNSTYQAFRAIQDVDDSENYEIARYKKTVSVDKLNMEDQVRELLEFTDFKYALDSLDEQKFDNFKIKKI